MSKRFVSISEVAARCDISHVTALKRLRAGSIPGRLAHHGMTRVDRKVFETWLLSQGSRKS